jgi:hypothetical protein
MPAGLTLMVNGIAFTDGQRIVSWPGYELQLEATPQLAPDGTYRALTNWEDGTTTTLRVVTTPDGNTTYVATFNRIIYRSYLPLVRRD